jgi:hypothetical protein
LKLKDIRLGKSGWRIGSARSKAGSCVISKSNPIA